MLIYPHKQHALEDVRRLLAAEHIVMIDDKPHVLAAMTQVMGLRLTTVFVRQNSEQLAELKIRVVNVVDLMRLQPRSEHPHGLTTPFDMTVLNDMDRFHLVMDVRQQGLRLARRA